jgi:hypothetical protein
VIVSGTVEDGKILTDSNTVRTKADLISNRIVLELTAEKKKSTTIESQLFFSSRWRNVWTHSGIVSHGVINPAALPSSTICSSIISTILFHITE